MDHRRYDIASIESPDGDYRWPTLRSKLFPIVCIRVPIGIPFLSFDWGPNTYHGRYWCLMLGPWMWLGGAVEIVE